MTEPEFLPIDIRFLLHSCDGDINVAASQFEFENSEGGDADFAITGKVKIGRPGAAASEVQFWEFVHRDGEIATVDTAWSNNVADDWKRELPGISREVIEEIYDAIIEKFDDGHDLGKLIEKWGEDTYQDEY